jgi:predicted component of type VI protein secretion system
LISKRHCALLVKAGKVFVRDFDSTNGTFVNDEQVQGERQLKHDDQLKVGPLTFRVVLEASPPVDKPTPPPPKASDPSDDDSVAAMLLSLQDEADPSPRAGDGVPDGTTVMELISPLASDTVQQESPKEDEKKDPPPKKDAGNTSAAAAAILEKYTRRQRT